MYIAKLLLSFIQVLIGVQQQLLVICSKCRQALSNCQACRIVHNLLSITFIVAQLPSAKEDPTFIFQNNIHSE